MDTGKGTFVFLEEATQAKKARLENEYPNHGGWFRVGEILEINGSRFRVKKVTPKELTLRLLPRGDG